MILKLLVGTTLTLLIVLVMPLNSYGDSHDHDFTVNTRAEMAEKESLRVTQTVQVRNRTRAGMEELEIALISDAVSDVAVEYKGGGKIPFSTLAKHDSMAGRKIEFKSLLLDLPRKNDGSGRTWSVVVSYTTAEGWHSLGKGGTVVIPNLDSGLGGDWVLSLVSRPGFPGINYAPDVAEYSNSSKAQRAVFTSKQYSVPVVAASFLGDVTSEVNFERKLRNRRLWPKTLEVVIPPDTHNQQVYLDEITPAPDDVAVDKDGNVTARYRLLPFQSVNVNYRATVAVSHIRYDNSQAKPAKDTPEKLQRLTAGNIIWTTEGQAGDKAAELGDGQASAWKNAAGMARFVQEEISPEETESRRTADEVLSTGTGNELERADLLIAMLRSQGIPARLMLGYAYPAAGIDDQGKPASWVEAYIAGSGWVMFDPGRSNLFRNLGYGPADRVALAAISSEKTDIQEPRELLETIESFVLSVSEEDLPPRKIELELTNMRYMIAPFLGFDEVRTKLTSGYVIDGLEMNGSVIGTIAPYQQVVSRQWFAGNSEPAKAVVGTGEEVLREADTVVKWWPAAVLGAVAVSVLMLQFLRWYKISKYKKRRLDGKILH